MKAITGLIGRDALVEKAVQEARKGRHVLLTGPVGAGKSAVLEAVIERLERRLAGAVGTATAHAMIAQFAEGAAVSAQDLMAVASEAQQILEYSTQLEAKSEELARTARQLQEANDKLRDLSVQKDTFLSQISHELRTPMTSIRAFSEILMDPDLPGALQQK